MREEKDIFIFYRIYIFLSLEKKANHVKQRKEYTVEKEDKIIVFKKFK